MIQKEFYVQLQVKQQIPKNVGAVVQNDINGNRFMVSLVDGVNPVDITGYTTITFTVLKPDNTYYVDSIGDRIVVINPKRGELSIILGTQAVTKPGLCQAVIEVWQNNIRITSAKLIYLVIPDISYGADPTSESDYPALLSLMSQLSSAEGLRVTAEDGRVLAETGRVNAELARVTAENQREIRMTQLEAEADQRLDAIEAVATNNESIRQSQEVTRQAQESVRQKNELIRQNSIADIENRWYTLTAEQQQDAEVIDARRGKTSLGEKIDDIDSQLTEMAISVKQFGAKGDGVTDDTLAIQNALNLCVTSGRDLFFPAGEYKVTQPISIERTTADLFYTPKIYGAGICLGNSRKFASTIKGYNIPAKKAIIEILGSRNGQTVSPYIENIGIEQDLSTCDTLSFCLYLGDSRQLFCNRINLYGYNGILLRSGTKVGAVDYANICAKFTQVQVELPMYYGWDGTIVDEKNKYGWAFLHEIALSDNPAGSVMDNVIFDSCMFYGSVFVFTATTLFQNCMWYIPGFIKGSLAFSSNPNYATKMSTKTFNFSNALWIAGGTVRLQNCYFEDVPKCLYINTILGFNSRTYIANSHFNGKSNFPSVGDKYLSDYVVSIDNVGGGSLIFENNNLSDGPTGTPWYREGTIKNNINNYIIIAKNNTSNNFTIIDNSYLGAIVHKNNAVSNIFNYANTFNVIFSGMKLLAGSIGKLSITDLTKYKIPVSCRLKRVDIYTNAKMVSDWKVVIQDNGITKYSLPVKEVSIPNDYCNEIYTEAGKNGVRYTFENYLDQSPYNTMGNKINSFNPTDLVSVIINSSYTSNVADNTIDCNVELIFSYD